MILIRIALNSETFAEPSAKPNFRPFPNEIRTIKITLQIIWL